jgi:hypothetical protein
LQDSGSFSSAAFAQSALPVVRDVAISFHMEMTFQLTITLPTGMWNIV